MRQAARVKELEKLLPLLESAPAERDGFVSHLNWVRREYRRTCETGGKPGKQIERCVISRHSGSPRAWASGWTSCGPVSVRKAGVSVTVQYIKIADQLVASRVSVGKSSTVGPVEGEKAPTATTK